MQVRLPDQTEVTAKIKGKKMRPVCGDRVVVFPMAGETEWLISGICKRRNELARPDSRGKREVLAANLELMVVMAAAEPAPDWFVVDRYLAAAENMQIDAAVAFNKSDLIESSQYSDNLTIYESCLYSVVKTPRRRQSGCT